MDFSESNDPRKEAVVMFIVKKYYPKMESFAKEIFKLLKIQQDDGSFVISQDMLIPFGITIGKKMMKKIIIDRDYVVENEIIMLNWNVVEKLIRIEHNTYFVLIYSIMSNYEIIVDQICNHFDQQCQNIFEKRKVCELEVFT